MPVSGNAVDTAENAGISECTSLCTNQISCASLATKQHPATFQLAQLALTDVTYLKSVYLCRSKTVLEKSVLPLDTAIFKSDEEAERREPTELRNVCIWEQFTLKSQRRCVRNCFLYAGIRSVPGSVGE